MCGVWFGGGFRRDLRETEAKDAEVEVRGVAVRPGRCLATFDREGRQSPKSNTGFPQEGTLGRPKPRMSTKQKRISVTRINGGLLGVTVETLGRPKPRMPSTPLKSGELQSVMTPKGEVAL